MIGIRELLRGEVTELPESGIDPVTYVPRIGWIVGASFCFTGTNRAAEGPRLEQHLKRMMGLYGDPLVADGLPGDFAQEMLDNVQYQVTADTNAGWTDKIDFGLLEFTSEALLDAINLTTVTVTKLTAAVPIMAQRAKKVYALVYPPYGSRNIPYFEFIGLTDEAWETWRDGYNTAMEAAGATMFDAHYDWMPTGRPVPNLAYPDYHIDSESCYRAAKRIMTQVRSDYT